MIAKAITTVSVGNNYYHKLTKNLIRSFLLHNKSSIVFNLLTDNPSAFVEFAAIENIKIQNLANAIKEIGFTAKFYLFDYALAQENLFIDCDCLIYKDLSTVFEKFSTKNFSAIGTQQSKGEFFCDIAETTKRFDLDSMPSFVGSIYYFKKNEIAEEIFNTAKKLKGEYDELGFIRLRGKENEEPLFAIAMALKNETCIEDPTVKADMMFYQSENANVLTGKNQLNINISQSELSKRYGNQSVRNAAIIHFNANFTEHWLYKAEQFRLKIKIFWIAEILSLLVFKVPYSVFAITKNIVRPLFRFIVGTRKIKPSQREFI